MRPYLLIANVLVAAMFVVAISVATVTHSGTEILSLWGIFYYGTTSFSLATLIANIIALLR